MKHCLYVLALLLSLTSTAQNISGLYAGTLYNDTTRMVQHYELALSEYKGKITGYSYTTFVVNDTFYYGIRRVKATRAGDELIVEDAQMLVNNFPESPAKGVRRITTIPLNGQDSIIDLKGRWRTTQTKQYYSVPGSLEIKRNNDSARSALMAHLKELNMVAYGPAQTGTATVKPITKEKGEKTKVAKQTQTETASAKPTEKEEPLKTKTAEKQTKTAPVAGNANIPIPYGQRQQKTVETLNVNSDSLVLSFYDNGVVDGDIISVYLNGQNVISNTKLTGLATKKTIYLNTITTDTATLVLVAENLGSLPPNTGLLTVQDGNNRYEVRFSADLQTNAVLVLQRKK